MTTELTVTGMSCGGCESAVVEALEGVDGVERASADSDAGVAVVEGNADTADLVTAVEGAGYSASA